MLNPEVRQCPDVAPTFEEKDVREDQRKHVPWKKEKDTHASVARQSLSQRSTLARAEASPMISPEPMTSVFRVQETQKERK